MSVVLPTTRIAMNPLERALAQILDAHIEDWKEAKHYESEGGVNDDD